MGRLHDVKWEATWLSGEGGKKRTLINLYIYIYTYFIILKFKVLCFIFKIAIKFDHTQFTRKINLKKIIKIFIRTYLPNFKLV